MGLKAIQLHKHAWAERLDGVYSEQTSASCATDDALRTTVKSKGMGLNWDDDPGYRRCMGAWEEQT